MRHIGTVIAAIVVAPLAWILLAVGQDRSAQVFANAQDGRAVGANDLVRPLLLLAAAGILLGLIATLRFSPLGAVLTGTVYAASYVGLLISPTWLLDLLNHKLTLAGRQVDPATPVRTGTTLLLGSLLLVAVASVQRWRRWPRAVDDTSAPVPLNDFRSPAPGQDHPLGADGLGLTNPGKAAEPTPAMAGGPRWADSLPSGSGDAAWRSDRTR
jgi:hypothetical protein